MAYQSFFSGNQPSAPSSAPSGGGYKSYFGTKPSANPPAVSVPSKQSNSSLTPVATLQKQQQAKQKQQTKTGISGALHHVTNAIGDVFHAGVSAGKAVVRPVSSAVTGHGGEAAHDVAQLGADVGLGSFQHQVMSQVKYLAGPRATDAERKQLLDNQLKAQQAIKTGKVSPDTVKLLHQSQGTVQGAIKTTALIANGAPDKQIQAQIKADHKAANDNIKSAVGNAIQLGSLGLGGGEVAGVKEAVEGGAKAVAKKAATGAATGAVVGGSGTVANNPEASAKDVAKSAAIGALVGGAVPVIAGKVLPGEKAPPTTTKVPSSIVGQVPKAAENDVKAAPLARNFVIQKYQQFIKPVQNAAKGMSDHDVKLLDEIEGNHPNAADAAQHLAAVTARADNPEQFGKVVGLIRRGYNARLASDLELGRDVGVRYNYLPHYFDRGDAATANKLDELEAKKAYMINKALPGYTHARTIENYATAADLGLKRQNANALEDFEQAMNSAGYEHGSAVLQKKLEEAHPNQVQIGKIGRGSDQEQYDQLKIAGGQHLGLPKDLAAKYNARAPYEYRQSGLGKALKAYDAANAGVKYGKLGGGFFHALTTTGTTLGQQVASLNLVRHPIQNLRVVAGTLSRQAHEANWAKLSANADHHVDNLSTADRMALAGVTTKPREILGDANIKALDKVKDSHLNFIKNVHDMVFQRQIPESKALMFEQATRKLDSRVPEDLAKMRKVASAVNNLGGINRAVSGLSYHTFKQASRIILATDFTEGKLRTVAAALSKGGPEGRIARQMIVGKSLIFALPGVAAAVASGKLDPSNIKQLEAEIKQQILDPNIPLNTRGAPSKSNPKGAPQAAHLPHTFVSELAGIIQPIFNQAETNKASGAEAYAKNRLAALPVLGVDLKTNKDFYGNPIYGQDKNGNPLGPGKTALNIGAQVAPIPAVQTGKTASGQQNVETAALNVAGLNVKGNPSSAEVAHSNAVKEFYNTKNQILGQRRKVTTQINDLVAKGNVNQAKRLAEHWNSGLDAKLLPFRSKYSGHYNPAWDDPKNPQGFHSLFIPITDSAFKSRLKSQQNKAAILNANY